MDNSFQHFPLAPRQKTADENERSHITCRCLMNPTPSTSTHDIRTVDWLRPKITQPESVRVVPAQFQQTSQLYHHSQTQSISRDNLSITDTHKKLACPIQISQRPTWQRFCTVYNRRICTFWGPAFARLRIREKSYRSSLRGAELWTLEDWLRYVWMYSKPGFHPAESFLQQPQNVSPDETPPKKLPTNNAYCSIYPTQEDHTLSPSYCRVFRRALRALYAQQNFSRKRKNSHTWTSANHSGS